MKRQTAAIKHYIAEHRERVIPLFFLICAALAGYGLQWQGTAPLDEPIQAAAEEPPAESGNERLYRQGMRTRYRPLADPFAASAQNKRMEKGELPIHREIRWQQTGMNQVQRDPTDGFQGTISGGGREIRIERGVLKEGQHSEAQMTITAGK